jgi:hypothetical protein
MIAICLGVAALAAAGAVFCWMLAKERPPWWPPEAPPPSLPQDYQSLAWRNCTHSMGRCRKHMTHGGVCRNYPCPYKPERSPAHELYGKED